MHCVPDPDPRGLAKRQKHKHNNNTEDENVQLCMLYNRARLQRVLRSHFGQNCPILCRMYLVQ